MTGMHKAPGQLMAAEAAEALSVYARAAQQQLAAGPSGATALYTIARGSSDAAANVLSYEFMRELGLPMTSLPPSVFSLGQGVALRGAIALIVSQSGASDDLLRSARAAQAAGAQVMAITNQPQSPVETVAGLTIPIGAGPERAVPATKTVCGTIGAGQALLGALSPAYRSHAMADADTLSDLQPNPPQTDALQSALLRARHVFVIGRDTGYGAAIELALKLKECAALHAEAYSSAEVLHGPLQLATNPLLALILDTGLAATQDSLDQSEARLRAAGCAVHRVRVRDFDVALKTPAAAAALLLAALYPVVLNISRALGYDPDHPQTLSKVTQTT